MSCKVLLLDEDATSAEELQIGLRELGCEVTLVDVPDTFGASRALARVTKEAFDLLVVSASSPAMGGGDVCERIKRDATTKSLRIILVGTEADIRAARASPRSHPDGYVRRPVDRGALCAEVQKWFPTLTRAVANSQTRLATVPPAPREDGAEEIDEAALVDWEDPPGAVGNRPKAADDEATKLTEALAEVQRSLDRERATHESNVIRGRHALVTARAAKRAATRKSEARREHAEKSLLELEHVRQELVQHGREQRAAIDALVRDHEQTLGLIKAAHDEERTRAAARLAETSARRDDLARQLGQAQARAGSVADAAAAEHEGRRAELEAQLAETRALTASTEATSSAKIASLQNDLESQLRAHAAGRQALEQELEQARAAIEELRRNQDRASEDLTTQRVEHEAALASAAVDSGRKLDELRSQTAATAQVVAGESEALRLQVVTALEQERARRVTLEERLHASDTARAELEALQQRTAGELDAERKGHADALGRAALAPLQKLRRAEDAVTAERAKTAAATTALERAQALHTELLAAHDREVARALGAENEIAALRTVHEAEAREQLEAARRTHQEHEQAIARERETLASEKAARSEVEAARGRVEAARAELEAAHADDVAQLAATRSLQRGAEEALAALRVAHADELTELDQSVDRMLEQERGAAATLLEETRRAAVEAVALGVADAQRAGKAALDEAQREAKAELTGALATHDRARDAALAEETARGAAVLAKERSAAEKVLADERSRAAAILAEERALAGRALGEERLRAAAALQEEHAASARALADEQARAAALLETTERREEERHARAIAERDEEARRARALEDELVAAKTSADELARELDALRCALDTERSDREAEARRVRAEEQTRARTAAEELAQLEARRIDVVTDRDARLAEIRGLEAEVHAADEARAEAREAHVQLTSVFDVARAEHAAALARMLAESNEQARRTEESHAALLEAERAEQSAALARLEEAASERLRVSNASVADLRARLEEVTGERDERTTRMDGLEHELRAAKAAHAEGERALQERALVLEAAKRDVEAASAKAEAAGEQRLRAAENELSTLDARHAEVVAELGVRTARVDSLEVELRSVVTRGEAARDAHSVSLQAQRAEYDASLEAQRAVHRESIEAQRSDHEASLEAQRMRHATALAAASTEHASVLARLDADAACALRAANEATSELRVRYQAVVAERDGSSARVEALEAALTASDTAKKDVDHERQNLARALEEERSEHASALARAATEADAQASDAERKLEAERARHAELVALRDEESENRLAASTARLEELEGRHHLAAEEHDVRVAALEESLAAATLALETERVAAAAVLASTESQLTERHAELLADRHAKAAARERDLLAERDTAYANVATLEKEVEASRVIQADLARDRERLAGEVEAAKTLQATETERSAADARDRARAAEAKLAEFEARHAASLASMAAEQETRRRLELADERDRQAARRRELEAEHATAARTREAAHAEVLEKRDAAHAELRIAQDAAHAAATTTLAAAHAEELADVLAARDSAHADALAARDADLADALARRDAEHAKVLASRDAALAEALTKRDATHTAAIEVRDSAYADSLRSHDAEHAETLGARDAAHAENVARLEAAHAAALADIHRALAEQTALTEAGDAKQSGAFVAHEELVKGLRKELGSALGALAAERQRKAMEAAHGKALEKKRSSGNHRAVKPDAALAERPTPPPPANVPKMSGERTVTHTEPRTVLRNILARALGGEAHAELVLAAVLGAANTKELPIHGDALLAVLERYLHSELRGQLGEKQAHAVMDELAEALVARVTTRPERDVEDGAHHSTTRPPPADEGPITKDLERPVIPPDPRPVRGAGRRAVLVIDKDRMARANVSRALAREGCEITVRDSCANIGQGAEEFDVIVTEIVDVAVEELVKAFSRGRAPCRVVAWTASVDAAQVMLESAGVGPFSVVVKEARADALVAAIRECVGAAPGVARG